MVSADLREPIRARAREEGFDTIGFARAERPHGAAEGLADFLARDHEGDMAWMRTTSERRADPHVEH